MPYKDRWAITYMVWCAEDNSLKAVIGTERWGGFYLLKKHCPNKICQLQK